MKTIVLVFTVLCCMQLGLVAANPGLFGNFFGGIGNLATGAVKAVTGTANTIVNTATSVGTGITKTVADATQNIPIINTVTGTVNNVAKQAEAVIDTAAQTTANSINVVADSANGLAQQMAQAVDSFSLGNLNPSNGTSICTNLNNILNNVLSSINNNQPLPANLGDFLNSAQSFVSGALASLGVPALAPTALAQIFNLNLTNLLALPVNVANLAEDILANLSALNLNLTLAALQNPLLWPLVPFLLKLQLKLFIAYLAANATATALNAVANG
ncbi:hypothetical protein DMENIID0001_067560 [Sergentomyia squamirostris]